MKKEFRELILESGLTLEELSKNSGVSKECITKLIKGEIIDPFISDIFYIAKEINQPVHIVTFSILKTIRKRNKKAYMELYGRFEKK